MDGNSKRDLVRRCQELEAALALWIAANDAKDEHIQELQAERDHLQGQVARLSRRVGRPRAGAAPTRLRNAH